MVKYSTLRKDMKKAIFEGEQLKASNIVNKPIQILGVSNVLGGEFGNFKIVQAKLNKKLVTFPVNGKTAIYEDLEIMAAALKEGKTIETKLKRVPSKSTKGRSYYQFE